MAITKDEHGTPVFDFAHSMAFDELPTEYKHVSIEAHLDGITTTRITVWDIVSLYNWVPTATLINVASTDVDDKADGTGARTVKIYGLEANYDEINETVTLNGQTIVATTKAFYRINKVDVLTAGSSGWNEGNIYFFTGTATNGLPDDSTKIYAKIIFETLFGGFGENQTHMGVYTIPAGYRAHFHSPHADSNKAKQFELWIAVREFGEVFRNRYRGMLIDTLEPPTDFHLLVDEKADVQIMAATAAGTGDLALTLNAVLKKKAFNRNGT